MLGPSLFLYYINDLPAKLHSSVRLFADDTIAYLVIRSHEDADLLQEDLVTPAEWEEQWRMTFQPSKGTKMPVSGKRDPIMTDYDLHGHTLANGQVPRCHRNPGSQVGYPYSKYICESRPDHRLPEKKSEHRRSLH